MAGVIGQGTVKLFNKNKVTAATAAAAAAPVIPAATLKNLHKRPELPYNLLKNIFCPRLTFQSVDYDIALMP